MTPDEAVMNAMRLHAAGQPREAEQLCRGVLSIDPDHVEAHNELGCALMEMMLYDHVRGRHTAIRRTHEALYHFGRALKKRPDHPVVLTNRGVALLELGESDAAMVDLTRSVRIRKNNPIGWDNLGNGLDRTERYDEAIEAFGMAICYDPNRALTHTNLGIVLRKVGRLDEAAAEFQAALDLGLEPDHAADATYNLATTNLARGRLAEGFAQYEARFETTDHRKPLYGPFSQPRWRGEDLAGKTLLVCAEQGLGDTIQFLRYVPYLEVIAPRVLLAVHEPIRPMVSFPGIEVLTPNTPWPAFHVHCNLMSLPHLLYCGDEIPAPWNPFPAFRPRSGEVKNVGLCWSGFWQHKNDHHRSIDFRLFREMMVDGLSYASLQQEVRPVDQDAFSVSGIFAPSLGNYGETARVLAHLDLVVTVDTSVAHFAGSLGIPTWVLVPAHATDWRWMTGREDSPWYPSVRVFRQPDLRDWTSQKERNKAWLSVLHRIRDKLAVAVEHRALESA